MGSGQKTNNYLVKGVAPALNKFKYEIANELNIDLAKVQGGYWGYMPTRETGAIGGNMVRRMIEAAERTLAEQTVSQVKAGFQAGLNTSSQVQSQNQNQSQNQFTTSNSTSMNNNNFPS
jgi:small acid-soluble spore protein A (major alpha-type SASP)